MIKISSGSKQINQDMFNRLSKDGPQKLYVGIGLVYKPDNESSHCEIDDDTIWLHVKMMPHENPVFARLTTSAAGDSAGVWKVPKPGTEVLIICPSGEPSGDCYIVGITPSGKLPDGIDEDKLIVSNSDGDIDLTGSVVNINGSDYSLLKTDDFLSDLSTALTSIVSANYITGALVETTPGQIAILTDKLTSGDYKSTKAKNG